VQRFKQHLLFLELFERPEARAIEGHLKSKSAQQVSDIWPFHALNTFDRFAEKEAARFSEMPDPLDLGRARGRGTSAEARRQRGGWSPSRVHGPRV